jgi:Tol biopolymer transport system component
VETASSGAVWSSDGKHLLFAAARPDGLDWWVAPVVGGRAVRTGAFDVLSRHGIEVLTSWPTPCDWRGNRVLFHARHGDTTNIWDVELSPSFRLAGAPRRLTLATEDHRNPSLGPDDSFLFSSRTETPYLWELRLDTDRGDASSAEPRPLILIPHHLGRGINQLSADGRWMAYASVLPRSTGITVKDLDRGLETVLTTSSQGIDERYPVISRDGSKVVYSVVENGRDAVRRITVKGGLPETLCQDCGYATGWSPDERYVLLQYGVPERASLGVLDTVSARRSEILKHPTRELYRATFSPDGRWMAFHASVISGLTQEFVAPFRNLRVVPESEWVPITDGSSWTDVPAWSPSGDLLYYMSDADGFRCIWAQPLDPRTKRPSAKAFVVHHAHGRKRSIGNVNIWGLELSVARGKLVFNMGESRGNIWLARYRE